MSDPIRWSEGGDSSELERELLAAGQAVKLAEGERRALWASLALSLPAAPPPSELAAQLPRAAAATARAYLTKGVVFLAAIGGLTFGAARLLPHSPPTSAPRSAAHPAAALSAAHVSASAVPTLPLLAPPAPVTSAAVKTSMPAASEARARVASPSQLREESLAVLEARAALRAGDAARSLALLERARARFPRGALGQEREALAIEALAASGQRSQAKLRAAAFLRAHPQSPYSVDVRRVNER